MIENNFELEYFGKGFVDIGLIEKKNSLKMERLERNCL